ncbi:hypothetical protein B0T18DRAFT_186912 [Schizothecium vesticola]|uniref:Uncharacterized protein n=1 Tax=Schizothecium vesticola TaxID=314040 RepID=A0AA40K2N3_9PEZI|nr:hypothetical protein B0T18DRAFT_186912 [Schizothecium vesticola]
MVAVDEMRRSSSLCLSLCLASTGDAVSLLSPLLSDFSPVSAARRRQTGSLPSIQNRARVARRNGDAGFSTTGRPSQSRWVSCRLPGNSPQRHGAVARGLISLRQGKVGGGVPPQIPVHIATLTLAPVWKRRNHAFRSTWITQRVQGTNIIACRCPDILVPSDITRSRLSKAISILQVHPPRRCRSADDDPGLFPGCLGWRVFFWTLLCDGDTGHRETSFVRLRLMRQIGGLK